MTTTPTGHRFDPNISLFFCLSFSIYPLAFFLLKSIYSLAFDSDKRVRKRNLRIHAVPTPNPTIDLLVTPSLPLLLAYI